MAAPVARPPADPGKVRRLTRRIAGSRKDGWAALGFLAPSTTGFLIFTLLPIIGALTIAFFAWPVLGERSFTGLSNFRVLFTADPMFYTVLWNTFVFVALYVPLNFVVSLGLAVWISSSGIKARGLYRVIFFLPAVTPIVANALVWRLLLYPGGILDNYVARYFGTSALNVLADPRYAMLAVVLMSVWIGFGYNMLIFCAGLDAIPEHLYEAAAIDGAGPLRRFWNITLPMLSPSMFFAAVMTLITSWQVFTQPFILTGGGPGVSTQTLVMYMYQRGFQLFDLGQASAIATVLFLIIVLVTGLQFIAQRRWVHYDA
jgi:multiple sugar transport system permease protein